MKLWSFHWQDPRRAQLVSEDRWFLQNEALLIRIVNTDFGRDLLNIPKDYPYIFKVRKNCVHAVFSDDGIVAKCIADFRVGAKWANLIRTRWEQFNSYARYFINDDVQTLMSPMTRYARSLVCDTLTAYPDPHPETSTVDGQVVNGGSSTTWSTVRGASSGSSADDSGTNMLPLVGKDASGRFEIRRNYQLFDTSTLTASASISGVVYSLYAQTGGANNDNDGNDFFCVVTSSPASNTALVTGDFDDVGATEQHDSGGRIDYSAISTSAYNDWTFNATGIGNVSKTGISKFAMREGHDFIDEAYVGANNSYNWRAFSTAENSGTTQDPKLVVTYSVLVASTIYLKGRPRNRYDLTGVSLG